MTELRSQTQYEDTLQQIRNSNKNIVSETTYYNVTEKYVLKRIRFILHAQYKDMF